MVCVVYQSVEDGIGEGGVADAVVPFFHGQLTGGEGRACAVAVVEEFEQVAALLGVGFDQSPIVEDEDLGVGECGAEFRVTAVAFGEGQV